MVTRVEVEAAQARIAGRIRRTPLLDTGDGRLWIKCEFLQHAGVFKTRGAFNRQLAARERGELDDRNGIVVASGGNAGLANAYAASVLGVPATVFVPANAPAVKVDRLRAYGAVVHQVGTEYADAYDAATTHAAEQDAVFVHAYDQSEVVAGAGTLGLEILEDEPSIDTIVVAVGGGGLYAGVAAAAHDRARIVAVEPTSIPTLRSALDAGRPVDVTVSGITADSLGARRVGEIAFEVAQRTGPTSVLVGDDDITAARTALWGRYRIPAEYGAAAAYAALTSGAYVPEPGERVAVLICGANTDPATLAQE
ncbi:threonine/serine dehydratase [Nocardioides marmoriginsengisoli]|uniref:Threonine/serine dehydratase n=1 Tax=Nocardioides marmoriginsengisoli TaxID=661483 RepID=A0A3N0CL96_9ACTN|nr:threonine/serine dehydratase [Nocardioides marmoriginsengisoli]RNL64218.1 threonine/serine dehydratase [Nocardioides marmoriginsengisoli]